MGIEEFSPDLLSVVLPTVFGVGMVLVTVAIVFWLGSGSQKSYEEAKAQASRRAEEAMKEKEHSSPRAKKSKKNFRRKKADEPQEETEIAPPKGILKSIPVSASPSSPPSERSPLLHKVEFKLDTQAKEETKVQRASPPTPYPVKNAGVPSQQTPLVRTPQPLFEEEEEEEEEKEKEAEVLVKPSVVPKSKAPEIKKKPLPAASPAPPPPASSHASKKKVAAKASKLAALDGPQDVLSASRITEILGASSLSDEEIQQLIELLLEKSNANAEWEGANLKAESNKSLKKLSLELQSRLEEAQLTMLAHSGKVKELRKELLADKSKHQTAENALQAKITQQNNEMSIFKARASGLEEEIKQTKAQADTQRLQNLNEDNGRLTSQANHLQQQVTNLTGQLQDMFGKNKNLMAELERARESFKASGGGPNVMDKLAEKDSLLEQQNREMEQLQRTMLDSQSEMVRLKNDLQSLLVVRDEMQKKLDSQEDERNRLVGEFHLQKDQLTKMESLRESFESSKTQDLAQLRTELQDKHAGEVEGLRKAVSELDSLRDAESEVGGLRETVLKLETQNKGLQNELDLLQQATTNGIAEPLSNGGNDDSPSQNEQLEEVTKDKALLEKKLVDLKSKNDELSDNLWKTKAESAEAQNALEDKLKQVQELSEKRVMSAKAETLVEAQQGYRGVLQQLFPGVSMEDCNGRFEEWLEAFESKAKDFIEVKSEENSSMRERVDELEKHKEDSIVEIKQFRKTLEATMEILKKLQSEVDDSNDNHQLILQEKETALEKEHSINESLQEDLQKGREAVAQVEEKLAREKAAVARIQEELETRKAGEADPEEDERLGQLEQRLQEAEQSRKNVEQEVGDLRIELRQKEKTWKELEERVSVECKLKEEAEMKSDKCMSEVNKLEEELKTSLSNLDTMKQSNRELNARLSAIATPSKATDSEV